MRSRTQRMTYVLPNVEQGRLRAEARAINDVIDVLAEFDEASISRVLSIVAQLLPKEKTAEAALADLGAFTMALENTE